MPIKSKVRTVVVDPADAERRLDKFLATLLTDAPKSLIYRIIRSGEVRVNGGRVQPGLRLKADDKVRIPPVAITADVPPPIAASVLDGLEQAILYEDAQLLVLNKPAGLAVHSGSGLRYGAVDALRQLRPGAERIDLVHRLDRETSGCLLLAKDHRTLRLINDLLSRGVVKKEYLALLRGRLPRGQTVVDAELAATRDERHERRMVVAGGGLAARSRFLVRRRLAFATLATVHLDTGRTHQIRVHASHLGHPIAGDSRYGNADFNQQVHELGLRRLFLHAHRIRLPLPVEFSVVAPLPADLQEVIDRLGSGSAA